MLGECSEIRLCRTAISFVVKERYWCASDDRDLLDSEPGPDASGIRIAVLTRRKVAHTLIEDHQLRHQRGRIALAPGATSMPFTSCPFKFAFLPFALADGFGPLLFARKSVTLFWLIVASLVYAACEDPVLANQPEASPGLASPISDAIIQNTPGKSQGYAVGVPKSYAWSSGSYKPRVGTAPPSDFTAVTAWGQVYPKAGAPKYSNPDGSIIIANAKAYVHLKATREWISVQDQTTDEITGAHFVADFSAKPSIQMRLDVQPDGSVAIGFPPPGYNDHFWIIKRGTYAAGSVDGVYVQMDMRTDDPNVKLVANVGADWWRDETAEFVRGFANNPGAGMSNWIELSTRWSTLRFYSWSTSKLLTNPPPPLAEAKPAPVVGQRSAAGVPPRLSGP
jgi:hypothetical protein